MEKDKLLKAYSGPEAVALLLKEKLNAAGINAMVKNDSFDAYMGAAPRVVDLYISSSDLQRAEPIIQGIINHEKS